MEEKISAFWNISWNGETDVKDYWYQLVIPHSFLARIHKRDIEKIDLINRELMLVPILIANFNFRRAYHRTNDSARGIYINQ